MNVFISKKVSNESHLKAFCLKNNYKLLDKSLIAFQAIEIHEPPPLTDVVFFSSPRSVQYFLKQHLFQANQLLAVMGQGTLNELNIYGHKADFVGNGNPTETSKRFKEWLQEKTVLFPVSNRSNLSIQTVLNKSQYHNLPIYLTDLRPIKINSEVLDILIFTSPSNVESYFKTNQILKKNVIISFGETTQKHLNSLGYESIQLDEPTELGLVKTIEKVISRNNELK